MDTRVLDDWEHTILERERIDDTIEILKKYIKV